MLTNLISQPAIPALEPPRSDPGLAERAEAGRLLAQRLHCYRGGRAVVLALPPGGVLVASQVAHALRLPFDVLAAREFALAAYPALVAGALSEAGGLCLNATLLHLPGVTLNDLWTQARRTHTQIASLISLYRHGQPLPRLARRPVIVVDDGLGNGLLQLAALAGLHHFHPERLIIATPSGSQAALELIARWADAIVSLDSLTQESGCDGKHSRRALGDQEVAAWIQHRRASS